MAIPFPSHISRSVSANGELGRRPLGALLVDRGLLTPGRLAEALNEVATTGRRLGEVLLARRWAFETELARVLAEQYGLKYLDLEATSVDPAAAALLPRDFAEHFTAVPVRKLASGAMLVAVGDPGGVDAEALAIALGCPIQLGVADPSAIRNHWRHCAE